MKTLTSSDADLGRELAARARVRGIRTLERDTGFSAAWVSKSIRELEANPLRWRGWDADRLIRMCGALGVGLAWEAFADSVPGQQRPGRRPALTDPD